MKRFFIPFLGILLSLAIFTPVYSYFLDVDEFTPNRKGIELLYQHGIVSGYADGTYRYAQFLNRAELLKIIVYAAYPHTEIESYSHTQCFNDVPGGVWFSGPICFAQAQGIVTGYTDGYFRPDAAVTVGESLTMALKTFQYEYNLTDPWFEGIFAVGSENNFIPLTFVFPAQNVTRGEMADMIARILMAKEGQLNEYLGELSLKKMVYDKPQGMLLETFLTPYDDNKYKNFSYDDLKALWNIDVNKATRADVVCLWDLSFEDALRNYKFNYDPEGTGYELSLSGINVRLFLPKGVTSEDPVIKGGIALTEAWLENIQQYYGPYPCPQLTILPYENAANGGPGFLNIGGHQGFNEYFLIWHELTHSYFGSDSASSLWAREGVSDAMPTIIFELAYDSIPWNKTDFSRTPLLQDGTLETVHAHFASLDDAKVYYEKNACNLKEVKIWPEDYTYYKENADWGRMFLFELMTKFGKKPVSNTLRAVYEKYRYSNLTKFTDEDFYNAFLYYMSTQSGPLFDEAEQLLKTKLCL